MNRNFRVSNFVVLFVIGGKEEQRVCNKFCVKLGKTFTETFHMLQTAFEDECLSRSKCHEEMWANGEWMLHHDNAPVHFSLLIRDFFTKNAMTVVPHPLYPPDLAPTNFFLFPKIKRPINGEKIDDIEGIKKKSLEELKSILEEDFQKAFL